MRSSRNGHSPIDLLKFILGFSSPFHSSIIKSQIHHSPFNFPRLCGFSMQLLLHVKHDLSIINPESDQSIPTLEPPRSFLNSSQAFPIRNSIFPLNPNHVKFFFSYFRQLPHVLVRSLMSHPPIPQGSPS